MLKIAICDDKKEQIEIIKNAVLSYDERFNVDFNIDTYENSFEFAGKLENGMAYDILLLDICMPGLLGTEVAKTVRQRKDKAEIIFLTTSDEFAVDAFALKAAHYLLKPFTQNKFDEAMDRALSHIRTEVNCLISIKVKNGKRDVNIADIYYCESYNHLQTLHLKAEEIETRESMVELLERLNSKSNFFIVPCKGYIVNLSKIKVLTKSEIILESGEKLPVATRLYSHVKDAYFDYRFSCGC